MNYFNFDCLIGVRAAKSLKMPAIRSVIKQEGKTTILK